MPNKDYKEGPTVHILEGLSDPELRQAVLRELRPITNAIALEIKRRRARRLVIEIELPEGNDWP